MVRGDWRLLWFILRLLTLPQTMLIVYLEVFIGLIRVHNRIFRVRLLTLPQTLNFSRTFPPLACVVFRRCGGEHATIRIVVSTAVVVVWVVVVLLLFLLLFSLPFVPSFSFSFSSSLAAASAAVISRLVGVSEWVSDVMLV